jgi:hypothetical protein
MLRSVRPAPRSFAGTLMSSSAKRRKPSRIPLRASSGRMDFPTARRWEDLHWQLLRATHEPGTPSRFETLRSLAPRPPTIVMAIGGSSFEYSSTTCAAVRQMPSAVMKKAVP